MGESQSKPKQDKSSSKQNEEKKFAQVTGKNPGILKKAEVRIKMIEKKLNDDRPNEGYGIWAKEESTTIKVVISKGSPPSNYASVDGQTLGEMTFAKTDVADSSKWKILKSCAINHDETEGGHGF